MRRLGGIDFGSYDFGAGINRLRVRESDTLLYAIRLVLGHKTPPPLPDFWKAAEARAEAEVLIEGKPYFIEIAPSEDEKAPILRAQGAQGATVTAEYRYLCTHSPEQDAADLFDNRQSLTPRPLFGYANEDLCYAPRELARRTEGVSSLRAFRAYLREFIRGFEAEPLCAGKPYEFFLTPSGEYAVRRRDRIEPVLLSASEQTLFRYLCFLRTVEFWHGFESMRNLHSIKKPLLITHFLECLDESIDILALLSRTAALGRQVLLFEPWSCGRVGL